MKNAQALYARWEQLLNDKRADKAEFGWTTNELRTNLKSIGWDLEDLAETVSIVKATPAKFNVRLWMRAVSKVFNWGPDIMFFPQLTEEEIRSREDFISRMTGIHKVSFGR